MCKDYNHNSELLLSVLQKQYEILNSRSMVYGQPPSNVVLLPCWRCSVATEIKLIMLLCVLTIFLRLRSQLMKYRHFWRNHFIFVYTCRFWLPATIAFGCLLCIFCDYLATLRCVVERECSART